MIPYSLFEERYPTDPVELMDLWRVLVEMVSIKK